MQNCYTRSTRTHVEWPATDRVAHPAASAFGRALFARTLKYMTTAPAAAPAAAPVRTPTPAAVATTAANDEVGTTRVATVIPATTTCAPVALKCKRSSSILR
eukprot:TRINITY_DN40555_c0_g1_i1.p1 TRINITY_DN40555_c0_g1~~TRINITY_DN40555_c0_g1_i1.p1  ORF type:complete len:102 (-),score=8.11 TRINITY_DN40555_c0_g1_i1:45-350(-)